MRAMVSGDGKTLVPPPCIHWRLLAGELLGSWILKNNIESSQNYLSQNYLFEITKCADC